MAHRNKKRAGLTLLELMISMVLIAAVVGIPIAALRSFNQAYQAAAITSELDLQARRAMKTIVERIRATSQDVIGPPGLGPGVTSSWIDSQAATFAGGARAWDNAERIAFEYLPTDPDDGVDNDGNGLVDDGRIVWIQNLGPGQQVTTLCSWVSEGLEGETPANLADDNGNGLIDERGLSFEVLGELITVRITLARRYEGQLLMHSIDRTVSFRNTGS